MEDHTAYTPPTYTAIDADYAANSQEDRTTAQRQHRRGAQTTLNTNTTPPPPNTQTPPPPPATRRRTPRAPRISLWTPTPRTVFLTRAPLLRHTPSRTKRQISEVWAKEWWGFVRATTAADKRRALLRAFAFPACILLALPKRRQQDARAEHQSTRQLIHHRIEQWTSGREELVWHLVLRRASKAASAQRTTTPTRDQNLAKACKLAQEGAFAKAIRALDSAGVHAPTPEVQRILEEKHPQQTPRTDSAHCTHTHTLPPIPPHAPFTPQEILRCAKKFPKGSAGGGSGLTPTHLLELLHAPGADGDNGLLKALAKSMDILAKGEGPPCLAQWLAGAPLTALRKEDDGVRPIAVGETVRRLISSLLLARHAEKAKEILTPLQIGVAVSNGGEAVIHAARDLAHRFGHDHRYSLLTVDLRNAFNLVSRAAFRREVRLHLPGLHNWVQYCYGAGHEPELWVNKYRFRSVCGVQQGDPLGPLLFSLALQPVLKKLHTKIAEWRTELGLPPISTTAGATTPPPHSAPTTNALLADNTHNSTTNTSPSMLAFYLDDGMIIERHEIIQRALNFLQSGEVVGYGLHLRVDKCWRWWPTQPPRMIAAQYPSMLQVNNTEGHNVLKSPIGAHRYMMQEVLQRAEELAPKFKAIPDLHDAHTSFALLRSCLGVCQFNYLLRSTPATATRRGATLVDDHIYDALNELAGGTLPRSTFHEAQLPLQPVDDTPNFGLGLYSAVTIAPGAYLASFSHTLPLVRRMTGDALGVVALNYHWYANNTYRLLVTRTRQGETPPLSEFNKGESSPSQKDLTKLLHRKAWHDIPRGDERTRAFRATLALPGAKDWAKATPSPRTLTHAANSHFRTWLKFYFRMPIRNRGSATCSRGACSKELDMYGDHSLMCNYASLTGRATRNLRHDRQVQLLADDLRRACRSPRIEPKEQHIAHTRPDIRAIGRDGGDDIIDVSMAHTFGSESMCKRTISNPTTILRSRYEAKMRKHTPLLQNQTGGRIVPIIFAVSGGREPRSYEYVRTLVRELNAREGANRREHTAQFFHKHAIRLLVSNMDALTYDLEYEGQSELTTMTTP